MKKKINVIGSGIAGMACATFLAKAGHEVTVLEKNESIGGRARVFEHDGFRFDMGPSWYWMPEVFERYYEQFGHSSSDFYTLKRLSPSYRIFWKDESSSDIPASMTELHTWFESLEQGSSKALEKFLKEAAYKYKTGMGDLVFKPGLSWSEFWDWRIVKGLFSLHMTTSFSTYIRSYFKHPKILALLEFPVLFLGAMPKDTPALYSLMNYADMELGTWYPMGGMHQIVQAFQQVAENQGVFFQTDCEVTGFNYANKRITSCQTKQGEIAADFVVSGADYHHSESLLQPERANYNEKYWDKRKMAPSCLIYYLGVQTKVAGLLHHNLFFDADFEQHAKEIYEDPKWPNAPLFYVCCPSKTDPSVAPIGQENMFLLMPLAPDLKDTPELRELYFERMMDRIEKRTQTKIKKQVIYKKSYCITDFKNDYHAYKGNAYGLANTLRQTAVLKPKIRNNKLENLYYTGQLTVPGPGVPPAIISGEVVAKEVVKKINQSKK